MNRNLWKMLLRSIRSSLGRYLAIMAIVALGVGFYAGLKSSRPAMLSTADEYLREQHFYDFQLLSSLGFTAEDVDAFASLEGVAAAEGGCFADAYVLSDGGEHVYRLMSLPERVDVPVVTEGRMPETAGECLADSHAFSSRDIGKTVTVTEDNDSGTLDMLPLRSYTIVGLAKSPRYISTLRDSTTLGSGTADGFLLLPAEAFSSEVFHEIRLWCDLPGTLYSDEYDAAHARREADVRTLLSRRGAARYLQLRAQADAELADARAKLDEGWDELRRGQAEAEQELSDAEQSLREAEETLLNARWQVAQGQKELDEGMARIPSARAEIAAGREEIAAGWAEWEAGRAELEENEAQLATYRQLLDTAQEQLDSREAELRALLEGSEAAKYAALAPYYQAVVTLQTEIYLLQARIDALKAQEEGQDALPELEARLAEAQAELAEAQAELERQEQSYDPETAEMVEAETVIARIRSAMAELNARLAEGEAALADGRARLDAAEAELRAGTARLDAAEAELDAAEADRPENQRQLDAALAEVVRGEEELARGWEEYEDGRARAARELADGEEALRDAQRELETAAAEADERLQLDVYTLDRSVNPGYVSFENDTGIIDGLASVFPLFFALVAAMVCVTTMTRMVNDERTVIGTLKAMGYGGAVTAKYLLYASSSALLGCVIGYLLGATAIPFVVWLAYNIQYTYADLKIWISPAMVAGILGLAVLGTAAVTWLACRRELAENPAALIRPKAPKNGRRILLERVPLLWRRLPFLSKVSLRNAFRHPLRVLMMLLGIGGCTALIVAGLGARDSIARISDYQYGEILLYDLSVSLDTDRLSPDAAAALWSDEAELWAMTVQEPVTLRAGDREKSTRLIAAEDGALEGLLSLHDKTGELPFPGPGEAEITEKLSDVLSVGAGDAVSLRRDDGATLDLTVTGVCKNYLNHYVFLNTASLGDAPGNTALLRAAPETDPGRLAARLRAEDAVTYVSLTAQEREQMEQSMASMDMLVVLLVVCSGALAFITLYNLTNINIMERTREIATVKVLGFFPGETASYILRENLLLAVLGAGAGLALGKGLHTLVIQAVVVENMTCERRIAPLSYVLAFAAAMLFTVLTNAVMRRRLETVDMAESLKSVE